MTVIIAIREGEKAWLFGDTRVEDRGKLRPDVIPGRLKIVVLSNYLTVAFAGYADPANVSIRRARSILLQNGLQPCLDYLRAATVDHDFELIIAAHNPTLSLGRFRKGLFTQINHVGVLGHRAPLDEALSRVEGKLHDADHFHISFVDYFMREGTIGFPEVGGVPIVSNAIAGEHRYRQLSGVSIFRFPSLAGGGEVEEPLENVLTGDGHYRLQVVPCTAHGVPVVGVVLAQALMGYVYSPIERAQPFHVTLAQRGFDGIDNQSALTDAMQRELVKAVDRLPPT